MTAATLKFVIRRFETKSVVETVQGDSEKALKRCIQLYLASDKCVSYYYEEAAS